MRRIALALLLSTLTAGAYAQSPTCKGQADDKKLAGAAPGTAAPAASTAQPAPKRAERPARPPTTTGVGSPADAAFPTAVSPKYSTETAGKARMHTCLDQYNANKAANRNGGLNWIQKGGGYYSECNKRLKG